MKQKQWFKRISDNASGREAAEKAHIPTTTLNHQLRNSTLTAESVIALCRAYGHSPISGLVTIGFLSPEEAKAPTARESAALLSSQELIHELAMRIDENEESWSGTFDSVLSEASVVDFPAEDFLNAPYAADSSPDEPMEGDEDYGDGP